MKKIIRKIGENLPGFLKGALAVSLLCLAVLCIVLVREKLLKNANEMGCCWRKAMPWRRKTASASTACCWNWG